MKHHTQRGVVALITLVAITTMIGAGPSALSAVRAEPPAPAAGMVTLEGPLPSSLFPTFWAIDNNNTSGASLAVDDDGGVHAALSGFTPITFNGVTLYPVYYGYCAEDCANPASWSWTIAGQVGMGASDCDGVRLALDPQGRPRLMWYYLESPLASVGYWEYAECNANCLDNASWTVADAITVNPLAFPGKGRYFALDPQGRPRFIYREVNAWAGRAGTYYRFCNANCADGGTWSEYRLNESFLYDASLAFNASGLARLAYRTGDYLAYYENLDGANAWSGGFFFNLGVDASFSLRLDSHDRPRLAIFNGSSGTAPTTDRLSYAWCQTGCDSVGNWTLQDLGLPEDYGKDVDMVLDAQDRPHLAFNVDYIGSPSVYGLGYARCTANCESSAATWQAAMVETSDELDATQPIPPATQGCYSYWLETGKRPSLAVDAAGNVRIGYNCVHYQGGGACSRVDPDIRLVRLAIMDGDDDGDGGSPTPTVTRTPPRIVTPRPDQTEQLHVPVIRTR